MEKNKPQIEILPWAEPLLAHARYKGAHGGRGSGKSHQFAAIVVAAMAEDIQAIADGIAHASDPVSVNAARLQIDARKWLLAKRQPKKYGEKVDLNLGGQQQDTGPVQFEFKIVK